ncbi:MAG: hypothetical protein CMF69_11660 [Magnetovibrio sp.]|nr:hypothetical protein [Magnetovibrio sp.]|tara:strand:+ start:5570 stop:6052 length:483 start_codon:yes stop_codon:yes gene_type:complete
MDATWIEEFEKMEGEYDDLYKESVKNIDIFLIYVNSDNEMFHMKSENIILEDGILKKEYLIGLLRKYRIHDNKQYSPLSLLKYNILLDPLEIRTFLEDPEKYNFITLERYIHSIKWEDTIGMFHDLNSLHVIFYEKLLERSTTKKIYLYKKNSKTRRKYM